MIQMLPMTEIPEDDFPTLTDRDKALAELRKLPLEEGLFLVRQQDDEEFSAAFDLQGGHSGKWVLGKVCETIIERPQPGNPQYIIKSFRHTTYLYFGTVTLEQYCRQPKDLVDAIEELQILGISDVITSNMSLWEKCLDDDPFIPYKFPNAPYDLMINMLVMDSAKGMYE